MSNSPINFLGMLGAASSLMGGRSAKKNAGKIRKRVSKLENQVGAMISKQNQGPTQVEQPIEIQPETPTGKRPDTKAGAGQTAAVKTVSGQRDEVADQKLSPHEPAPISYWELPDAIREEVPEIKFSVLVYAIDPADRFVLINGQRLVEGDNLMSGPVVKEIRRDGVIFSHRLYQFLVER